MFLLISTFLLFDHHLDANLCWEGGVMKGILYPLIQDTIISSLVNLFQLLRKYCSQPAIIHTWWECSSSCVLDAACLNNASSGSFPSTVSRNDLDIVWAENRCPLGTAGFLGFSVFINDYWMVFFLSIGLKINESHLL